MEGKKSFYKQDKKQMQSKRGEKTVGGKKENEIWGWAFLFCDIATENTLFHRLHNKEPCNSAKKLGAMYPSLFFFTTA